jgi:hypothetical protein
VIEKEVHLTLVHRPARWGDPGDTGGVRRAICEAAARLYIQDGGLRDVVRYLGRGFEELVPVANLPPDLSAPMVAALVLDLSKRAGIKRCFREGEVLLSSGGEDARALAVLEVRAGSGARPVSWWLALRRVAGGLFLDDWSTSEGAQLDLLDPAIRAWIDTGGAHTHTRSLRFQSSEKPSPSIHVTLLPLSEPAPTSAGAMAELVGRHTDGELLSGGLERPLVFLVHDAVIERWDVGGPLPCSMDDFVRNIVSFSEAQAAATVHAGTFDRDGRTHRAWVVVAEMDGQRMARILPRPVAGNQAIAFFMTQAPPGADAWFGVAPEVRLEVQALVPSMWTGGVVAEA